jgi:hypothetical protein
MNETQLVGAIKAHIARGDKARDKPEQHYIAAGQYLKQLKDGHSGSWEEWEELLKAKVGIGKSRASELMQIADGRKTPEEVKEERRERQRLIPPSIDGEDGDEDNRVAPPEEIRKNILDSVARHKAVAKAYLKVLKISSLDRTMKDEVSAAIGGLITVWQSLQGTLGPPLGNVRWVKDDGGRSKSGLPRANEKAGDCVARAIAIATQKPYREVHDALIAGSVRHIREDNSEYAKWARRKGGVRVFHADHGCTPEVYGAYLESLDWKHTPTKRQGIHLRANELPRGRLIVEISRHLVAVIDGVIHDTHDCGEGGRIRVQGYWSQT